MADNVVYAPFVTKLDLPAERVLNEALKAGLGSVVVIGYIKGEDEYFASSIADGGTVNWLLDRAKGKLLAMPDEEA